MDGVGTPPPDGGSDHGLRGRARAWRDADPDPDTRAEIVALLAADDLDALEDRFGAGLRFGTAGLRARLGAGPARMNRAVARRVAVGLGTWLTPGPGPGSTVVVGRDARRGSEAFAADAAAVLAAAGFDVVALDGPVPTPLLAFSVRHLSAAAGLMVTASHNPPSDNGIKVYVAGGVPLAAPDDEVLAAAIDAVGPARLLPLDASGVRLAGRGPVEAYLDAVVSLVRPGGPRAVRSAYSALHGVGQSLLLEAFARAGFDAPVVVAAQAEPDPGFPTVRSPNPEQPEARVRALALGRAVGADLVLVHDPDADRLAVAAGAGGALRDVTGDEVGSLLADHLVRGGGLGPGDIFVSTVASSRLVQRIAAEAGVAHAETLTGFKWIVRAPGPARRLALGYEEALGYSVGGVVRDKDGIGAALVVAEAAAEAASQGSSLLDRLDDLSRRYGAHVTEARTLAAAASQPAATMARLRARFGAGRGAAALAGRRVVYVEDLSEGERLPAADVLVVELGAGGSGGPGAGVAGVRLVMRPSGTEPLLKVYTEAVAEVGTAGPAAA